MAVREHHGRVAAAILGLLIQRGKITGGLEINLPVVLNELREDGGLWLGRDMAVLWALGFIERTGGLDDGEDRQAIVALLGQGYDELRRVLNVDN